MTDVMLLLWAADAADGLQALGVVLAILIPMCFIFSLMFASIELGIEFDEIKKVKPFLRYFAAALAVAIFLATLLPTGNVLRLYAATVAGKELSETRIGGKALQAVESALDRIIAGEKK